MIAAVNIVIPGRKPHIDALHHRIRLSEFVSHGDAANQERDAEESQACSPTIAASCVSDLEAAGKVAPAIRLAMIIGLALIESLVIYSLVLAFIIQAK